MRKVVLVIWSNFSNFRNRFRKCVYYSCVKSHLYQEKYLHGVPIKRVLNLSKSINFCTYNLTDFTVAKRFPATNVKLGNNRNWTVVTLAFINIRDRSFSDNTSIISDRSLKGQRVKMAGEISYRSAFISWPKFSPALVKTFVSRSKKKWS